MKLIQNIYYRLSSNILISALNFITSILIIRVFGTEVVGLIAYYISIFGMLSCLCDLGLSNALTKFISEQKINEKDLIATYFVLKMILLLNYIVISSIIIYYYKNTFDIALLFIFFCTFIVGNAIRNPLTSIFMAKRKFKSISKAQVFANITISMYSIILCLFFQNIYLLSIKMLLLYVSESIFVLYYFDQKISDCFILPNRQLIKKYIKFAYPLSLTTIVANIMAYADRFIIGQLIGMKELGFFEIAKRMFSPVDLVIKPVTSTLYPEILKNMLTKKDFFETSFKEIIQILTFVGIIIAMMMVYLSKPFVLIIYGADNFRAAIIFTFFSGLCISKLFLRPYHHLIHGLELQYIYPYITILSSFIRITGYYYLIPMQIHNIQVGSIAIPLINTLTWYIPGGLIVWYHIRKHYYKTYIFETIVKIFLPFISILFIGNYFHFHIYTFPILLLIFIMTQIYFGILSKSKLLMILQPLIIRFR